MMNNHCWHNARLKINEDDERVWPKLPDPNAQENSIQRSTILRPPMELASSSESNAFHEIFYDEINYPNLGEIVLKRKESTAKNEQLSICYNVSKPSSKRLRPSKRTDLIHINLQRALENQQWPLLLRTEKATKITVDICKLNVNMSVAGPLDDRSLHSKSKRSITHIEKKKSSRLKYGIKYRILKKEIAASKNQICEINEVQGDIPEINLDKLNINVVSRDDPELLKKMAALSCLGGNYRNVGQVNILEDTVVFRPDMHEKMDNMNLGNENEDTNAQYDDALDCDMMEATLSLKLCDETGEITDNITIKQEPGRIQFSKKFREYCTNTVTTELKNHLEEFLGEISRLQKRMYERNNIKGKSKRRYYGGIKEVQKHVMLKKIKFVVIATDLEKIEMEGSLDDTLNKFIGTCKRYEVPYCFGLGRRKLGYYIHGNGFVSCIGITNYSGTEEKFKNVLFDVVDARNEFARLSSDQSKIIDVSKLLPKEELILSEIINAYLKILTSPS